MKRFSIIIAAYNVENYIARAIKSVTSQTFENIEIIVVNDCSTDGTDDIIATLASKDEKIIYLQHEKNKRLGAVRNTGLGIATGEYIIFLDGDDYLANNDVLEKLDKVIGEEETDIVYLGFQIEGNRRELVIPTKKTCTKEYKATLDKYPNAWSKCWRREFLNKYNLRFPEYRLYEDVIFVYKSVMKSANYKIADFVTHIYISGRTDSITTKITLRNVEDTIKNIQELLEMRKEGNEDAIDVVIKKEQAMCKKRLDMAIKTAIK